MRFTKMQGAGNDFIIVGARELPPPPELGGAAARLCRRKFGVGADGLVAVSPPEDRGDIRMDFYNSDGTAGEMCGNGARCLTRYALERGLGREGRVIIETPSGLVTGWAAGPGEYTVALAPVTRLEPGVRLTAGGREIEADYIELGSPGLPHAVVEIGDPELWRREELLRDIARDARRSALFPRGANVTLWRREGDGTLRALTFERGVEDFTLACGTGAAATAAALAARGLLPGPETALQFPGGVLRVETRRGADGRIEPYLTGPAREVYSGEVGESIYRVI